MNVLDAFCPDASIESTHHVLPRIRVIRFGRFSARFDGRTIRVCVSLTLLILVTSIWSLNVGDFPIAVREVFATLVGRSDGKFDFIVWTLRLPRILTGIGVGASFGMAGALFQSLVRNPLGSPDIIGFNSGASFGAVISIVYLGGGAWMVSLSALLGGLIAALLVYLLSWRRGVQTYRLVLVGIGAAFGLNAAVDFMLTRGEINDVQRAATWLTGSLNGRSWTHVATIWIALIVLIPVVAASQSRLNRLELGDDTAAVLGARVSRSRFGLILAGVSLAALGVASAGPVAFVAFVSGPIARRLCKSGQPSLIPAAFVGAFITVAADLLARRAFAPTELPVGIFTAVIGAPYLLWQLRQQSIAGAL